MTLSWYISYEHLGLFMHQVGNLGKDLELDYDTVSRLASLPFSCYTVGFWHHLYF